MEIGDAVNEPTFISLFAGIGGADLGFERAGWKCVAQVEQNPWRRQVLAKHFPGVPQFDDICTVGAHNLPHADLIVGGFPCQDLSVAGKRAGLAGERSGLFFEFARILSELRPAWCLIENVPGLLSSCNGRDFAVLLTTLDELGYGVAWRILDSQHFGVPQRRRRVFVVGCLGGPCPPEVLFEPEGCGGDSEAGAEAGKRITSDPSGIAGSISQKWSKGSGGPAGDECYNLTVCSESGPGWWREGFGCLRAEGDSHPSRASHLIPTLRSGGAGRVPSPRRDGCDPIVAVRLAQTSSNRCGISEDGITHTLDGTGGDAVCAPTDPDRVREASGVPGRMDMQVCTCPDTPRYQALGDAMTVNVLEWIAKRIKAVIDSQTTTK